MVAAIRQQVTIQAGGVIEVRSPELLAGSKVEVIVLLDAPAEPAPRWGSFIGSARGLYGSVAEADAHIRELRDEWDR